tara:strand:- start:1555 stop:1902 length:348 start_codon:yes stop_codon:yes gene_type:complete
MANYIELAEHWAKKTLQVRDGSSWERFVETWDSGDGDMPDKSTLDALDSTVEASKAWVRLRNQRNAKLTESDYMANSDVTMSSAWKTYRQKLRDLPSTLNDTTVQETITWPDQPS